MLRNLAILFLATTAALAQSDRSTLTGAVLDGTGAVMPGVSVEAISQATGLKYATSSNELGIFALRQLPVGRYEVTAKAKGFLPSKVLADVHVAETVALNFTMLLGGAEPVAVEVAATEETITSVNSTGITEKLVTDLPLSVSGNTRNPESFIFLTPGVTGTAANTQINGSQSRAKEVLLDGVGATSPESGGTLFTYPSVEAIAEFRLVNSAFSAEYGRSGGGFEVFSTKSGTNTFHGTAASSPRQPPSIGRMNSAGRWAAPSPSRAYTTATSGPSSISFMTDSVTYNLRRILW